MPDISTTQAPVVGSPALPSCNKSEDVESRKDDRSSRESRTVMRSNLRRSVLDGVYFGGMVGIGETYIPAFALAVGLGEVVSGLVVSVPMLIGGIAQLISEPAIRWLGSYRKWIVATAYLQAAAFLPLIVAACTGFISPFWLFFIVSVYWGSGMASGPAWNVWIGKVVPTTIRSNFFARRTRLIQLATFSGFLVGGWLLYLAGQRQVALLGFACLFSLALVARVVSATYLAFHRVDEEEIFRSKSDSTVGRRKMDKMEIERVESSSGSSQLGWRLVTYLAVMQIFVQFSGPYFVPYMLKKLQFGYESYVALVACAFIGKALSMPLWGSVANRYGGRFLLTVGGIGVIPLASMWTVSDSFVWLMFVQLSSGILWAGYELGFFLVFLNDVPQGKRTRLLTIYNFANSAAWCGGSLLGGWLLASQGASYASYHLVFWISSIGRACCLLLLWNLHRIHGPAPFWRVKKRPEPLATSLALPPSVIGTSAAAVSVKAVAKSAAQKNIDQAA